MRVMYDSITVSNIPDGSALVGAYVDGRYNNIAEARARFGANKVVGIAVFAATNAGIVGDCEAGDMTPSSCVGWVQMRRRDGVDPTIYCSVANWATVQLAFRNAQVPEPHYWIAAYPGNGPQLYAGSVAHQWIDHGPYDESVVADYWPGVDPALAPQPPAPAPAPAPPAPPSNLTEGETMTSLISGGQLHVWGIIGNVSYHWWQPIGGATWSVEKLPL